MICICGHLKFPEEVLWAFLYNCIYSQAILEFLAKLGNHNALKNGNRVSTFEPSHQFSQNLICTFFHLKLPYHTL
jgi:hypothetical protein